MDYLDTYRTTQNLTMIDLITIRYYGDEFFICLFYFQIVYAILKNKEKLINFPKSS